MRTAGANEENIARELAKLPTDGVTDEALELGEDDEGPAIGLFLAMATQWRTAGTIGARAGLDYTAIRPTADLLGIDVHPGAMLDLRIMEDEALKVQMEALRK